MPGPRMPPPDAYYYGHPQHHGVHPQAQLYTAGDIIRMQEARDQHQHDRYMELASVFRPRSRSRSPPPRKQSKNKKTKRKKRRRQSESLHSRSSSDAGSRR